MTKKPYCVFHTSALILYGKITLQLGITRLCLSVISYLILLFTQTGFYCITRKRLQLRLDICFFLSYILVTKVFIYNRRDGTAFDSSAT